MMILMISWSKPPLVAHCPSFAVQETAAGLRLVKLRLLFTSIRWYARHYSHMLAMSRIWLGGLGCAFCCTFQPETASELHSTTDLLVVRNMRAHLQSHRLIVFKELNCPPFRPDSRHKQKGSSTGLRTGLCLTRIDTLNC